MIIETLEANPRLPWQVSSNGGLLLLWDEAGGWAGLVTDACPRTVGS